MLNVTGISKITNLKKVSDKLITGDIYTVKTVNNNPVSSFHKVKVVGKAMQTLLNDKITNRDTIKINNAIIEENTYKNKEGKELKEKIITLFEIEKYVKKMEEVDGDLPF